MPPVAFGVEIAATVSIQELPPITKKGDKSAALYG